MNRPSFDNIMDSTSARLGGVMPRVGDIAAIPQIFDLSKADRHYAKRHYIVLGCIVLLGAWLRFWGLGNIGLHGDEKTMALPTLQILDLGYPYLPSGIMYPRGLGQLYLMALSSWIFGPTEWAFRVPSAIVGTLAIPIAFLLGRRFVPPSWNLVFVLTVAIFPDMIVQSQTARMYIFLGTLAMLFAVLLFRWERMQTWPSLALATGSLVLSFLFHQLVIFSALLFFFPGLLHRKRRLVVQGLAGFGVAVGVFLPFKEWIEVQYGDNWTFPAVGPDPASSSGLRLLYGEHLWTAILLVFAAAGLVVWLFIANRRESRAVIWAIALLTAGLGACLLLYYHIGLLIVGAGAIVYLRSKGALTPFACFVAGAIGLFVLHSLLLSQHPSIFPNVKEILRGVNGQPSPWPYIKFAGYFPLGVVAYLLVLAYAIMRLARGNKVPDHFLFFILGVWLPIFLIGFFDWHIPPRFTYSFVGPFLIALVSGLYYILANLEQRQPQKGKYRYAVVVGLPLLLAVNPQELVMAVDRDYNTAPDHKGAGLFMKNRSLHPDDLVLAEDVLQQRYYFGEVDYWLRSVEDASGRVKEKNGRLYNYMTNTPLIGTGDELSSLLARKDRGAVYIVGTGERFFVDRREYFLGHGILDVIKKNKPETIYRGRDDKTLVWYFPPPRADS